MREIIKLFRAVKPDLVHLITIKPILLGGIAARVVGNDQRASSRK